MKKFSLLFLILVGGCCYASTNIAIVKAKDVRYPLGPGAVNGDADVVFERTCKLGWCK